MYSRYTKNINNININNSALKLKDKNGLIYFSTYFYPYFITLT